MWKYKLQAQKGGEPWLPGATISLGVKRQNARCLWMEKKEAVGIYLILPVLLWKMAKASILMVIRSFSVKTVSITSILKNLKIKSVDVDC